jgi:teichuronic acid biosynthesis glycosyltransferase TuaG
MEAIVTIITPTFNSEKYIEDAIKSVQNQTFVYWEMIIVDDFSSDRTCEIVEAIALVDIRITLIRQNENSGAAKARNKALQKSRGRFIAYLDADDIWYPQKLEKQVSFMLDKTCGFSCASYEVIDDNGSTLNKFIYMKDKVDYTGFLTNNLLQTVGIMVDTNLVDKNKLIMPNMRRRQDAATWLQVLKTGNQCYGINEILAKYRRTANSLSSNKFKAIKGIWYLYREVEKLSLAFSVYCFARYATLAVWKRVYINKN